MKRIKDEKDVVVLCNLINERPCVLPLLHSGRGLLRSQKHLTMVSALTQCCLVIETKQNSRFFLIDQSICSISNMENGTFLRNKRQGCSLRWSGPSWEAGVKLKKDLKRTTEACNWDSYACEWNSDKIVDQKAVEWASLDRQSLNFVQSLYLKWQADGFRYKNSKLLSIW